MFKLVIADDEGKTTVVPLVRDEITIGRKEGNTIRLTERNISRKHAKLRRANGAFVLEDLASYNGVKVNGKKIAAEVALKPGDQIVIGDYQLALQLDGDTAAQTIPEQTAPSAAPGGTDVVTAMIPTPGAQSGPPARLVMMSPPAPGAEYALSRDRMRIGRAEDLEIWVNHRSISREHAEVVARDGRLYIRDLASANGLRVNGSDAKEHELSPGDVIELGQVRFRYVPAGESFTFDEGRTIQMEAVSLPSEPSGPNRTTIYVAGGILGLALIAGVAIMFSGGSADPQVTQLPSSTVVVAGSGVPQPTVVAPTASPEAALAAAVQACQTALNSGDFATALARANEALALRPDDPAALACQQRATNDQAEGQIFVAGVTAYQQGNIQGAYLQFENLAVTSPYRQRPEVIQTMAQFANDSVVQAEAAASSDPTEANRLAQTVLAMTTLDPALRARAESVERQTRRAASGHPPVRPPHTGPVQVAPPPSSTVRPPPSSTVVRPPPSSTVRPPPSSTTPPPTTTASSGGGSEELTQCLTSGDDRCVVRLLGGGRAHGAAQLRALFQAQRNTGDRAGACGTARQLVSAAGVTPAQQSMIRQYMAAQCQ
jgi:pSer/pThr/pTyr-binding forkhead associated (FHA) protein